MILYEPGSHKVLRRVWVDCGDQKAYYLAKVGIHGEGIHGGGIGGVRRGWRLILGMRGGDQRPPGEGAERFLTLFQSYAFFKLSLLT